MTQKTLNVGIISSQPLTLYLPILQSLPYYQIAIIYDASHKGAVCPKDKTCNTAQTTTSIPQAATPDAVLEHPAVDLVLNFTAPALREKYTVAALASDKHVLVESPVSVSLPSAHRVVDAQRKSRGRVFVASPRRYAPCFETFKAEVASLERIYYARCRNIQGGVTQSESSSEYAEPEPNSKPASTKPTTTNGTSTLPFTNTSQNNTLHALLQESFQGQDLTTERILLSTLLTGPRGSPDLSTMRETLGAPDAVSNIAVNEPFYSAIFHYSGHDDLLNPDPESSSMMTVPTPKNKNAYMLTYEFGTDAVPRCDVHLAVYGSRKTVTLEYDGTVVRSVVEMADSNAPGEVVRRETTSSMEEAQRAELEALYKCVVQGQEEVHGKGQGKMMVEDSMKDLRLFREIFEQYDRQCGTIRTPLG